MKNCVRFTLAVGSLLAVGLPAYAQSTPAPNILQIFREEVKVGHGAAHAKTEAGWPRAFTKANWPTHYVALTTVTGPSEAWFITGFESLAAWEKDTQATEATPALQAELDRLSAEDAQHINNGRTIVARYRADLSHRPGVNLPAMRYFSVTTVRVRPGRNADFEASRKISVEAHKAAGVMDNHSVFQVMSGMPIGTFLIITPMKSMAEIDAGPQVHGQTYQDAVGDEGRKKLSELATSGTISAETTYFRVSPGMSYPSPEYVAADPGFWKPKPVRMAAPAKKEEKPAGQP